MTLPSVTIEFTPAFHDADPMGVVWHGHYLRFLEHAREALLDSFSYGYLAMEESGHAWPIVDCQLKYIAPVTFGQTVRITATLVEYENRLRIDYVIHDTATGRRTTKARTTQIAVNKATREMCFVSPPVLFQKLGLPPP